MKAILHSAVRLPGLAAGALALISLGLLLSLAGPSPVSGQSYLSGFPERSPANGIEAGGAVRSSLPPEDAGRPIEDLFEEVEEGNGQAVFKELKERFEYELVRAAANPEVDSAEFHRIYLLYLLRAGEGVAKAEAQEKTARTFVEYYPDDEDFPLAFFYLNQALFLQGKAMEESFFFDSEALKSLPAWMQTRFLRMQAATREREGKYAEAASLLLREKEEEGTLGQSSQAEIEELLERLGSPMELLVFLEDHPQVDWLYEREPFLIAKALVNEGRLDQALLKLEEILSRDLATSERDLKLVLDMKSEIKSRAATRPERIGVLLPLGAGSGLLRSLAKETLEGLRLAIQFPQAEGAAGSPFSRLLAQDLAIGVDSVQPRRKRTLPFELIIRDTGNNPGQAERAVESLVREDQVVAIIGPLARSESIGAAGKAEELGVPLISFSLSLDIQPGSRFVFRHSKSVEEEIRDLVLYAMDYMHLRRFAILYPNTNYGRRMMDLFWEEVRKREGKVAAAAWFLPSRRISNESRRRVGFKKIFEDFTGVNRPVSEEERVLIDAVGDSKPDPIVDFDAIFIPVGPNGIQDLQLIAPYPVTVDAEKVKLLGTRFWNDPAVLVAGDEKLEGAVFVDAFDVTSANPKVADFYTRHRTFFGHHPQYRPPSYYSGLGYDTANFLMSLLRNPEHRSRRNLRNALVRMEPYFGVTGWTRFKENGEAVKESMFFHIKDNEIIRLVP